MYIKPEDPTQPDQYTTQVYAIPLSPSALTLACSEVDVCGGLVLDVVRRLLANGSGDLEYHIKVIGPPKLHSNLLADFEWVGPTNG